MARYRAAHKDETRSRIVEAAGRLFRGDGYASSGIAKVMSAVDLTVGGFYAHFASKEALLSEVLALSLQRTKDVLLIGLDDTSGSAFVREVARRYLSRTHRDMAEDGCALPSLAAEIGRQSEKTRGAFEAFFVEMLNAIEPHFENEPASELSRRDHALALAALLTGGLMLARAVKTKELSDRILLACKRFALAEVPR